MKSAGDLEISPVYRDGILAELKVRVKNIRAGHNLPTSLTNVRQMWLEITAKDQSGKTVMTSGGLTAKGSLPEDTRIFNSDGMGDDFHFAVDPWVVTSFSRHDTIPPRGYKDVYYGIAAPKGVKSLVIEARLRYRQADQEVAEALLAAVPKDTGRFSNRRVFNLRTCKLSDLRTTNWSPCIFATVRGRPKRKPAVAWAFHAAQEDAGDSRSNQSVHAAELPGAD